jgi:hypothetical protein
MQEGANVLFFTFINPATMEIPLAFQKLGKHPKKDLDILFKGAVSTDIGFYFRFYKLNQHFL